MSKRLRRQNPGEVKRSAYAQGVRQGINNMTAETKEQVDKAYGIGFHEGGATAHIIMAIIALAAARGKFGFGKKRLQMLATEIEELTRLVNEGKVTIGEMLSMLQKEGVSFLDELVVTDGAGNKHVITPESILEKEKKALGGIRVAS